MVNTESVSPKSSPNALLRRVEPTVVALATGSALGWFFRRDIWGLLIEPWQEPNRILEGYPSPERVAAWFGFIPATVGIVLALPWLTALAWGLAVHKSRPIRGLPGYGFIIWSYAAIGIGLCLAAFVAFPAYVVSRREAWQGIVPVPWAFVELELEVTVGVALVSQLGAFLCAFVRVRLLQLLQSDEVPHRTL